MPPATCRRKVRSASPKRARAELDWSVADLWMLTLVGVRSIRAAGHPPRRLSAAGILAAVRHAAHTRPSDRALAHRLRRCVLDDAVRTSRKRSYRWPQKKNPLPPGEPSVAAATPAQVQAASALRRQKGVE